MRKLNKTQQKLYDEARLLIDKWHEIERAQRAYGYQRWHCVNVKRYHDSVDREDLERIARKAAPRAGAIVHTALVERVNHNIEHDQGYGIYYDWLSGLWYTLNNDVVETGNYSHIAIQSRSHIPITQEGRSGGWACFTTDGEDLASDLEQLTDEIEEYTKEVYPEVREKIKELAEVIEQVEALKAYIQSFNDGADFEDEILFRMEEIADELGYDVAKRLTIYDTGPDSTVDRYTIIFDGEAYGMSDDALSPTGFNQYIGNHNKLNMTALGTVTAWYKLPEDVQRAIALRITN